MQKLIDKLISSIKKKIQFREARLEIKLIIRNLLDNERGWQYVDYFQSVDKLIQKKIVYVFIFDSFRISHTFVEEDK